MDALALVSRQLPVKVGAGDAVLGTLTESSGWVIVDAAIGAGVGWFIAPKGQETGWVIGGALATGLAGVIGLAGLLGWRYIATPLMEGGKVKKNPAHLPAQARDYVVVSNRGRLIAGPFRYYDQARAEADAAGGYVKFAAEAHGRRTRARRRVSSTGAFVQHREGSFDYHGRRGILYRRGRDDHREGGPGWYAYVHGERRSAGPFPTKAGAIKTAKTMIDQR